MGEGEREIEGEEAERNKSCEKRRENAAAMIPDSYMLEEEDMAPPRGATSPGDNKQSQITEPAATIAMPASKKKKKNSSGGPAEVAKRRRTKCADLQGAPKRNPTTSAAETHEMEEMAATETSTQSEPAAGHSSQNVSPEDELGFNPRMMSQLRKAMREEFTYMCHAEGLLPKPSHSHQGLDRETSHDQTTHTERRESFLRGQFRGRRSPSPQYREGSESEGEHLEGGEFLSEEEEISEQCLPKETSNRFFNQEDFPFMLSRALATLALHQSDKTQDPKSCVLPKGHEEFFPSSTPQQTRFPMPQFFADKIRAEWKSPLGYKQSSSLVKNNYRLMDPSEEMLQIPKIDAPIAALQSHGLVTQDGDGTLKDPMDKNKQTNKKKTKQTALRRAHEAMATTTRAAIATSILSRALIVWAEG